MTTVTRRARLFVRLTTLTFNGSSSFFLSTLPYPRITRQMSRAARITRPYQAPPTRGVVSREDKG